jgi:hypothetical protein
LQNEESVIIDPASHVITFTSCLLSGELQGLVSFVAGSSKSQMSFTFMRTFPVAYLQMSIATLPK